jgi:choline-sulfatase
MTTAEQCGTRWLVYFTGDWSKHMDISRRTFTKGLAAGLGSSWLSQFSSASNAKTARRPNILFICSDQHSGLMSGDNPRMPLRIPNLQRLASRGVQFSNAYCASPLCAPARAAMMTGRFPSDVESYGNTTVFDGSAPTWGHYLRDSGYNCWATGKMDLTAGKDLGFTEVKTTHGHSKRPDITELFRRPMCYRIDERQLVDGHVGDRATADKALLDLALNHVKEQAGTHADPWVAYVCVTIPHPEFIAPEKYWHLYPPDQMPLPNLPPGHLENLHPVWQVLRDFSMFSNPIADERIRRARSAYSGMITELDDSIGTLLDELERSGALKDTIVIYTSDHGEEMGEHGIWLKRTLLEGASRVPLIMMGAGLPAGKVIDAPVSHLDLAATILDVAGVQRPKEFRGTSLLPLLAGKENAAPPTVYGECHMEGNCTGSFMVRRGDWKYIYFSYYADNLLFNLRGDPGEMNNLAGKPETASIEKEMRDALTSLVDPDAVTLRAFEKQDKFLSGLIQNNKPDDFYQILVGRLGQGQAALLTHKHYSSWKPTNLTPRMKHKAVE